MATQQEQDAAAVQTTEQTQETSLLDQILTDGKMARDDFQKERAKRYDRRIRRSGNERRTNDVQKYGCRQSTPALPKLTACFRHR